MTSDTVYQKAQVLVKQGITGATLPTATETVADPIGIHAPNGDIEGWFIGVVVDNRLLGFIRLETDLSVHGYSSFQRRPDSLDGCPDATSWLDPEKVLERARSLSSAGDTLEPPVLSYDQNPDRLAWAVTTKRQSGKSDTIYVAGEYVYVKETSGDDPEQTKIT